MARTRNLKPGFFENEELAQLDPLARLLFAGLWCWSDREGRIEDRPKRLKAQILPYDDRCNVDKLLSQLAESPGGFITRYSVNGCKYIAVNHFAKHQNPHIKENASTIPPPENPVLAPDKSGASDLHQTSPVLVPENPVLAGPSMGYGLPSPNHDVLVPPKSPNGDCAYSATFEAWWLRYPKHRRCNKPTAYKRYQAAGKTLVARGLTREEAVAFLLAQVIAFAASPLGQTKYAPAADVWLNKGRYDDAPEAWERGDDEADKEAPRESSTPWASDLPDPSRGATIHAK